MKDPGRVLVAGLVLSVLTLSIYGTLRDAGFVNFDDDYHVTDNEAVKYSASRALVMPTSDNRSPSCSLRARLGGKTPGVNQWGVRNSGK